MSKDTLALLVDVIMRVGVPTVLAGVLLWFLLDRFAHVIDVARVTQLEMKELLVRCCPIR